MLHSAKKLQLSTTAVWFLLYIYKHHFLQPLLHFHSSVSRSFSVRSRVSDPSIMEGAGAKKDDASGKNKNYEVGLWGGLGGTSWDDGIYDGVREITIVYGHCIDSIFVVYDKNGKPVKGEKHGGTGGYKTAQVILQYPDEFLINISGNCCPVVHGGSPVIRSLTLKSNKRTFGQFGVEEGTPFSFRIEDGRVVGFKGRGGWYLDAIGLHISRLPPPNILQMFHKTFKRLGSIAPRANQPKEAY